MTTNILIIGNGFDLAHALPTTYNNFMQVCERLIASGEHAEGLAFTTLFPSSDSDYLSLHNYYNIEGNTLSREDVQLFNSLLAKNPWYHYFKDKLQKDKLQKYTWIDFEGAIKEVLGLILNGFDVLDVKLKKDGGFPLREENFFYCGADFFNELVFNALKKFRFIDVIDKTCPIAQNGLITNINNASALQKVSWHEVSCQYVQCSTQSSNIGIAIKKSEFFDQIYIQLDKFIRAFEAYIDRIVNKLMIKKSTVLAHEELIKRYDEVYSFNYSNTLERLYNFSDLDKPIDYLHGKANLADEKEQREGSNQDAHIVLGVDDISDDLKTLKFYGFCKYHQKLMKNTDFSFLKRHEYSDFRVAIWGHSLDTSDQDYIHELFSHKGIGIDVLYHNDTAKFGYLSNLLHILGKETVETWMKANKLCFKPSPSIFSNV